MNQSPILLGTSSFTATGWKGSFYPKGLRPTDYLSYYAQHFDTVEIDSTFYATPSVNVVRSWDAKTPNGFLFAAKVPQEITHEKVLKDCDEEFKTFLTTMETLGEKLGPLLFQFGKFDKYAFKSLDDFLARLIPFLKKLPKEHKFAVEIRNKDTGKIGAVSAETCEHVKRNRKNQSRHDRHRLHNGARSSGSCDGERQMAVRNALGDCG